MAVMQLFLLNEFVNQSRISQLEYMTDKTTGHPGSVIVPQYGSRRITVFLWGKNTILKFLGNTK